MTTPVTYTAAQALVLLQLFWALLSRQHSIVTSWCTVSMRAMVVARGGGGGGGAQRSAWVGEAELGMSWQDRRRGGWSHGLGPRVPLTAGICTPFSRCTEQGYSVSHCTAPVSHLSSVPALCRARTEGRRKRGRSECGSGVGPARTSTSFLFFLMLPATPGVSDVR